MKSISNAILYELTNNQNNITLYHFDNEKYNIGDSITKYNNLFPIVKNIYKNYIDLDVTKLVYMLSFINDEYWDSYKYCYEVKAENFYLVQMSYSPIMAADFINMTFKNNINITSLEIEKIVNLFAKAYLGDLKAKEELQKEYDYHISNIEEYVTDLPVKVLKVYMEN